MFEKNCLIHIGIKCYLETYYSTHTYTQIGLSSDNRMANQFSKTFISIPVIFIFNLECYHCRVPDKEWSFQDGGLYIIKKVGVKILTIIVLYRLS